MKTKKYSSPITWNKMKFKIFFAVSDRLLRGCFVVVSRLLGFCHSVARSDDLKTIKIFYFRTEKSITNVVINFQLKFR